MSRHIITVMALHRHVMGCLTQAEVDRIVAGNVATTIRNHVIEACKAVVDELASPHANDVAKCAEALAVLSEGVHDVRRIMDAPGTWQSVLEAARDALDDAIAKTTNILEGETP